MSKEEVKSITFWMGLIPNSESRVNSTMLVHKPLKVSELQMD